MGDFIKCGRNEIFDAIETLGTLKTELAPKRLLNQRAEKALHRAAKSGYVAAATYWVLIWGQQL